MTTKEAAQVADSVYHKYVQFYGASLIQGAELLIAEEVAKLTGAKIITGTLTVEDVERAHYWCSLDGTTIDPVFHALKKSGVRVYRNVVETDIEEFKSNVERYRMYQI